MCHGCGKEYSEHEEEKAKKCCTQIIEFDDGDFLLPRKYGTPVARSHYCPNVTHGGKSWSVMLEVDENCPMCDYVYRPR